MRTMSKGSSQKHACKYIIHWLLPFLSSLCLMILTVHCVWIQLEPVHPIVLVEVVLFSQSISDLEPASQNGLKIKCISIKTIWLRPIIYISSTGISQYNVLTHQLMCQGFRPGILFLSIPYVWWTRQYCIIWTI